MVTQVDLIASFRGAGVVCDPEGGLVVHEKSGAGAEHAHVA